MAPKTVILIMRHAEKPEDDNDPHLAPAGVSRAKQLVTYMPKIFGNPDFIFASSDSKKSFRPRETVQPLAAARGLIVQTLFADAQFAAQADELHANVAYQGKLIVVCWHHGEIPSLMRALGAANGQYPDPWDPTVFNLILSTVMDVDGSLIVSEIQEPF